MDINALHPYIPLDKSWVIRMGVLDLVNDYDDIEKFLDNEKYLSDDLLALKSAVKNWRKGDEIDVGESGTLYRLLQFVSWQQKLNKKFIKHGTLQHRAICSDPNIIHWQQQQLLTLDNGTSQWATAKVLCGDTERIKNPPYKLLLTYEAVEHWNKQRNEGRSWEERYDETIFGQTEAFLDILSGKKTSWLPVQAEDFCFAYVFDFISADEGERLWPSLRGHESDRISEIAQALENAKKGAVVGSLDHRVVQALAMWGVVNKTPVQFFHPECVAKSWPRFWEMIDSINHQ